MSPRDIDLIGDELMYQKLYSKNSDEFNETPKANYLMGTLGL